VKPPICEAATDIVRRLQQASFSAFWVGGCVRDFLLGRKPGDYDIATSALPEQIEELFKRTVAVGRKFGVMVVVEGEQQFQVATFRAEADYRDGRHPETVSFGDARADALRRDFTINGLFYDPVTGKLHDWVGGEADLRKGVIRTIGSPAERFAEDHLRLLRAVRFAAQLGFQLEPQTLAALKANSARIKTISAERIRDELIKLFAPITRPQDGTTSHAQPPHPALSPGGERVAEGRVRGQRGKRKSPPRADWSCSATAGCSNTSCPNSPPRLRASNRRIFTRKARCSST